MTGPTTPGAHAPALVVGLPDPPEPPVGARFVGAVQTFVFESQHSPPMHVSPALHLFIGWHGQPSDPAMHIVPPPGAIVPPGPDAAPGS
jgi:hypothetical protein